MAEIEGIAHKPENFDRFGDVPDEWRRSARYRVQVNNAHTGRLVVEGFARTFEASPLKLTLTGAIVDSSERANGITLKEQWSYHEHLFFGGQIVWAISELAV
ncbi:MAG TPA: hypothetical protein VKW06_10505 [Candidatus Angelobacter sp.]|nr:hypothetical protein [Candidatus Angelobacter sp.]